MRNWEICSGVSLRFQLSAFQPFSFSDSPLFPQRPPVKTSPSAVKKTLASRQCFCSAPRTLLFQVSERISRHPSPIPLQTFRPPASIPRVLNRRSLLAAKTSRRTHLPLGPPTASSAFWYIPNLPDFVPICATREQPFPVPHMFKPPLEIRIGVVGSVYAAMADAGQAAERSRGAFVKSQDMTSYALSLICINSRVTR